MRGTRLDVASGYPVRPLREDERCGLSCVVHDIVLPDTQDLPAEALRQGSRTFVTLVVPQHLGFPEGGIRAGPSLRAAMDRAAVPEAAVDKHRDAVSWQNDVGCAARCEPRMETETCTCGVERAPERDLWGC
jgi:hypothetical protein